LKPGADEEDEDADGDSEDARWTQKLVGDFDYHKTCVSRVEWNITGTVLSSAGNDGKIRLWKASSRSVWRPAGNIGVDEVEQEPESGPDG